MARSAAQRTTRCNRISQIGILIFNTLIQVQAFSGQSEPPQFLIEPPDLVQFSNINGTLVKCQAKGKPSPSIAWLLSDGTPVSSVPGLRQVMDNGQLYFPPFKPEDYRQDIHTIIYRCSISNTHGVIISRDIQIQAVVNQPYQIYVTKSYTMKGNTGVIRCHVPQFLQEFVEVTAWIVDDKLIINKNEPPQKSKYIVSHSGDLFVTNVQMRDSNSSFQCRMRHKLTKLTQVSSMGRLQVTNPVGNVPPRIVDKDLQMTVNVGDTTFIPCIAEGHPVPNVHWFVKDETGVQNVILENERISLTSEGIVIKNTDSSDRKTFVCVASNNIGSDNKDVVLAVTEPLKASMIPESLVSDKEQTVTFVCNTTGFPAPTYITWLKDGKNLIESDDDVILNGFSLIIKMVKSSHKGIYQCIINNGKHSAQAKAELILGDSPPEFIDTFTEQILQPNTFLSLPCSACGTPMPQITWSLDGLSISSNIQTNIRNGCVTSFLNISSIKTEDGGTYHCTAKNEAGLRTHTARINVYGPLSARSGIKIFAVSGDNVYLNCPVMGYPIDTLIWKKDNIILPFDLQQVVLKNKTLVISKAQKSSDAGRYVCIALNENSQTAESSVDLSVLVPPKITAFQFQDNLREGMRVQLHCVVSDGDLPLTITWIKDEKPIPKDLLTSVRDIDDYSSILSITNVTAFHNGNYSCIASNAAAKTEHTAKLLVKVPPRWRILPHNSTVKKRSAISIPCKADGFPSPEIKWTKITGDVATGQRSELNNSKRINVLTDGTLQITDAQLEDQGFYFCSAKNLIGKGLSRVIYIKVQAPVYFESEIVELKVKINSTAELFCEVFGDLPIRLSWQFGNKTLQNSNKYWSTVMSTNNTFKSPHGLPSITNKLSITKVSKSDSGEYICEGRNSYGSAKTIVKLIVQEKPMSPEIVSIKNLDNRSVEVTWRSRNSGDLINNYILQYKKKYDSWVYKRVFTERIDARITSKVIDQLQPATAYEFRLSAENEIGSSEFSNIMTITLNEEAPEGPPQQVVVEATDRNSLRISWQPPSKHLWNGPIRGYYIGYKIAESSQEHAFKIFEVPEDYTNTLVYQLTNLEVYTKYSITLMAYNNGGSGPSTKEVIAITSEDVPRAPPQEVRCSTLSSHSVYIVWNSLHSEDINGNLLGYKVFYKVQHKWNVGIERWNATLVPRLSLQNLEANVNYSFEVLAYTKIGDGIRSAPVICRTYQDVPEAPKYIKALPSSPTSILLSWQYPFTINSEITMYNIYQKEIRTGEEVPVEYSFKDDAKSSQDKAVTVHTLGPDTNFFEFKNLNSNQRYAFWIAATSAVGRGPSSKIVMASPKSSPIAAKSASFSDSLSIPWKTDIVLPCLAVGIPLPRRRWLNGTKGINTNDRTKIRFDGALTIKRSQETDSNIYICIVENIYGRDEIQYTLLVQTPPKPPFLSVMSKSYYSINLRWEVDYQDLNNVRGYLLHYKQDKSDWIKKDIGPNQNTYKLQNLTCGAVYYIYIEAYNDVGIGEPCETIVATSQKNHFVIPPKDSIISEGDTYITMNLDMWPKDGCPLQYFTVEYKQQSALEFKEIPVQYQPFDKQIKIAGLESGHVYNLRLTAFTKGEPIIADYQAITSNSENLGPPSVIQKEEKIVMFYLDPWIFVPIVILIITIIIASLVVCYLMKKRNERRRRSDSQPPHWSEFGTLERTHPDLGVSVDSFIHMQRANNTLGRHTYGTLQRIREDPNPYATVHIPVFPPSHEMNLLPPDVPPPLPPGPEFSPLNGPQAWRFFENQEIPKNSHSWDQGYASAEFSPVTEGENIYATTSRRQPKNLNMQNTLPMPHNNDPSNETTFVFPHLSESHEQSPVRGLIAGNINTTSTATQHNADLLN